MSIRDFGVMGVKLSRLHTSNPKCCCLGYGVQYVSPEQRAKSLVETDTATQEPKGESASIRQRSKKPKCFSIG